MKQGKVQNPLTIIAIFAGIAEVAGTTVLLGLPIEIQRIFVWFVFIFPFVLIAAFFAILALNHKVLYAPSDFTNEQFFVDLLNKNQKLNDELSKMNETVVEAKEEAKEITKKVSNDENKKIEEYVSNFEKKLDLIEKQIEDAQYVLHREDNSGLSLVQKSILNCLTNVYPNGLTETEIFHNVRRPKASVSTGLMVLINYGLLKRDGDKYYKA